MFKFYQVIDQNASEIGRVPVVDGKVYMSTKEADHWLRMGAIAEIEG
jgi:hypothetical protein